MTRPPKHDPLFEFILRAKLYAFEIASLIGFLRILYELVRREILTFR